MSDTPDIFQELLRRKKKTQLTPAMDREIDREAAWHTIGEWLGVEANRASANLETLAREQEKQVHSELVNHKKEFLEALFQGFNSFEDFVSEKAAYVRYTIMMMTAQQLSMAYKHASEKIKPHFDGSAALAIATLWVFDLENCGVCRAKGKEKLQVYGLKLVLPERNDFLHGEEVMTPKLYCLCKEGEEFQVLTPYGIREGIQCGCGVDGKLAMLGSNEVNVKFISPQGMLELAEGGMEEMSPEMAISMKFPIRDTYNRPDHGPLKVVPERRAWPIDSHVQMFDLVQKQARILGGLHFDYLLRMQTLEWNEKEGIIVPHVEGHSAYFVKHASDEEIRKLLECGESLASVIRAMIYWYKKSKMHRGLKRYQDLVASDAIEEIEFSSKTNNGDIEEESRSIGDWTNFAVVGKLLVEQIMSLRRSDEEIFDKLLEESQTKASIAIREQMVVLEEAQREMGREELTMQQKRHAGEEMKGIISEASELMKRFGILVKRQKTIGK